MTPEQEAFWRKRYADFLLREIKKIDEWLELLKKPEPKTKVIDGRH